MARYVAEKDLWFCPRCTRELPGTDFYLSRRSATAKRAACLSLSHWCKRCWGTRKKSKINKSFTSRVVLDYFARIDQ
jgi:hypothetical protein